MGHPKTIQLTREETSCQSSLIGPEADNESGGNPTEKDTPKHLFNSDTEERRNVLMLKRLFYAADVIFELIQMITQTADMAAFGKSDL